MTIAAFFEGLTNLYLCFLIYSFIGWLYESNIWAPIEKKQFINRGFLIGPMCPIYGLVAIMDYYALCWIKHPVAIFFSAMIICCIFEYTISWSFEKMFKTRWWDYSNYAFNLNGRISLYSGIFFGVAGLLLVKVLHPFVYGSITKAPFYVRSIVGSIFGVLHITDVIFSSYCLKRVNSKLTKIYNSINDFNSKPFNYLNNNKEKVNNLVIVRSGKKIFVYVSNLNKELIFMEDKFKNKLKRNSNKSGNETEKTVNE